MGRDDDADDARARNIASEELQSSSPEIVAQSLRLVQAFIAIRSAEKRQAILDLVEQSAKSDALDS